MWNYFRVFLTLGSLLITTSVYSDSCCQYDEEFEGAFCVEDMVSAYNAPARINPKSGWNLYLNGSYILWEAREKGLDPIMINPSGISNPGSPVHVPFKYHSGYKASLATNLPRDDWLCQAEYTHLYLRNNLTSTIPSGATVIHTWISSSNAPASLSSLKAQWKTQYDCFDLWLSRPMQVGKSLNFNPSFGLRGIILDQKYVLHYFNTNTHISDNRSDSWMIGPRISIQCDWLLHSCFRFIGKIGGGLLHQEYDVRTKHYHTGGTYYVHSYNKSHQLVGNLDLDAGIGLGSYFINQNSHIDLSATYHFETFWNQNLMRSLVDEINNFSFSKPENLYFHGLVVTLQISF